MTLEPTKSRHARLQVHEELCRLRHIHLVSKR